MGIALFGAIGLVSTGFAAWVLSASASNTQEPGIKVGAVSEHNMDFQNIEVLGKSADPDAANPEELVATNKYSFNPKYTDITGRVHFGKGDDAANPDVGERLELIVRGEVTEAQNLGTLTVKFDSIPAALTSAESAGYIVLPECATAEKDVDFTLSGEGAIKTASFEYTIAFSWGNKFNGSNPGEYYDEDVNGKEIGIDVVETTLTAMHELLDNTGFSVTFVATPK